MDITRDYRVFIKTQSGAVKSHRMTKIEAILYVAKYLDNLRALECLDTGCWLKTTSPLTGCVEHYKRYWIVLPIPYTEIMIQKTTKGSIPMEDFERLIKYIKENYHEKF